MTLFIIVIVCFQAVSSVIIRGPSNVAVVSGTNMTMTCETTPGTNEVDWYHAPVRNKDVTPTLLRINHGSRIYRDFSEFSVEGTIPGESLYLKVTQFKHAGFYQCTATGQKATAQLVVLASEPQCNISSRVSKEESSQLDLICSVSYNGYWVPFMEWSQIAVGNTSARAIQVNAYVNDRSNNELTSNLSLVINSSTRGFTYSCKTYFKNDSSSHSTTTASNTPASNTPGYDSVWTSPNIEMLYGPKNVTVFPIKNVFHPGDVLMCSADSPAIPDFEWTEMKTGNIFRVPEIVINASMLRDEPYSFSCTASNKLTRADVKSSLLTFTVERKHGDDEHTVTSAIDRGVNSTDGRHPNFFLIISITAPSAVISIAFAGCLIVCKTKRKQKPVRDLPKQHDSLGTETGPAVIDEDTSAIYAVVTLPTRKSGNAQPTSFGGALSGSYEEIETESDGTPSSCYNLGNTSGVHKLHLNDEDIGSIERYSNGSGGSKETVKSTRYEDLLERDPVKPSVYLRIMQCKKEQETQTSNSPTSSEDITQSQTIYVNVRNASNSFGVKHEANL